MNRTIVIGDNSTFSKKTNKIAWVINGVILTSLGISELYRTPNENLSFIFAVILMLGGLYGILYAFLGLSKHSKFSPKIVLTDKHLTIKKSFWQSGLKIEWSELTSITFKPYQIDFQLSKELYIFEYETNAETSLEIKKSIRDYAVSKEIEVIGG